MERNIRRNVWADGGKGSEGKEEKRREGEMKRMEGKRRG